MLLKQNNHKAVVSTLFTGLITLLASCSNSAALESLVSPDPELIKGKTGQASVSPQSKGSLDSSPQKETDLSKNSQGDEKVLNKDDDSKSPKGASNVLKSGTEEKSGNLPTNFPKSFPLYPQAQLEEVKSGASPASGKLTWSTSDNRQAIVDYYQKELSAKDWNIIKPFTFNSSQKITRAIAIKNETRVDLTLVQPSVNDNPENKSDEIDGKIAKSTTKLHLIYQPIEEASPESSISQAIKSTEETNKIQPSPQAKINPENTDNITSQKSPETGLESEPELPNSEQATAIIPSQEYLNYSEVDFTDLDDVSEQLRQPLEIVAALGILTPYTANGNIELSKFAPNEVITRGEYARWLIAANNRYYDDNPGKKIFIPIKTQETAFQDIKAEHPDFGAIQGLAEAGLVPSRLTDDSTNLLFRADAPLTREDLITWKVPLDMRQALPKASIQAIEESWGFQDAAEINSTAIRALFADFQNGDRSNVRRIFGYTILFQPKKPVTRAEAAASIWYFGFQGDGITAREIWELETQSNS